MEVLSFAGLTEDQRMWLQRFIDDLDTIGIDSDVKQRAIRLRLERCLKLPDAIIAAIATTVAPLDGRFEITPSFWNPRNTRIDLSVS